MLSAATNEIDLACLKSAGSYTTAVYATNQIAFQAIRRIERIGSPKLPGDQSGRATVPTCSYASQGVTGTALMAHVAAELNLPKGIGSLRCLSK